VCFNPPLPINPDFSKKKENPRAPVNTIAKQNEQEEIPGIFSCFLLIFLICSAMVLTDTWVSFFGIRRGRVDVSKLSPPLRGKQEEKSCGKRKTLLFFFVEI